MSPLLRKGILKPRSENIAKGAAKVQAKSKMSNQSKFIADMTQVPKLASCKIGHQVLSAGQSIKEKILAKQNSEEKNQSRTKLGKNSNWDGSSELGSVVAGRSAKEEFKHEAKTIYTSFTFHKIVPPSQNHPLP